jgi:1-acyl-sn-glycerol-3-phosphate acyltransferase
MNNYYPGNEYHTPESMERDFLDKLFLGTRAYFYSLIFNVTLQAHRLAVRGEYDDSAWIESSYAMRVCHERCGAKCHFTELTKIEEREGPVVFIGNHMSTSETFLLPAIIVPRKKVTFVVKKNLLTYPMFGPVMKSRNPIVVGRRDPKEDFKVVMNDGVERLRNGVSVVVFPQSTRMAEFKPEQFNSIGVKLARKAGVPVVPFALKTDFWSNGAILKECGPIHRDRDVFIRFAPPMDVAGSGKDVHASIIDFIQEQLREWG